MSIQIQHIYKSYKDTQALTDISFEIKKGEIVGFLGPNGAGKSTLMKIITGYLKPNTGSVYINDIEIAKDLKIAQQKIGYLPEHNPLYVDLYIREYLTFNARIYHIDENRINEVIKQTGLSTELHKKIGDLSKGYRQRVGIANALLHDPEVLILDEPTTGLDPNQLTEIRSLIKEIGKNKTVLFSTHILQEVEAICNRIILIDKGRIVADQTINEIQDSNQKLETIFQQLTQQQ